MNIFKRDKEQSAQAEKPNNGNNSALAELALKSIHDGVIITDKNGLVQFINPAAVIMTGCTSADSSIGLDFGLIIKIESKEGRELSDQENPLIQAMKTNQVLEHCQVSLIDLSSDKRVPIAIAVHPTEGLSGNKIITFRDITKELEEEGEQTEFISTASHEMRTPVATIDGYLMLALNPQTATIDDRARGYLTAAEKASKHLGKLFQDLLDVTKLDDGKIKPMLEPVEMVEFTEEIFKDYEERAKELKLSFTFGSNDTVSMNPGRTMQQVVYGFIDTNFMREIMDNLIENALKYTPEGGSIYVNVRGDGDRVLVNVTDTGMGISADDLTHIFQKFYRADNSDTRTIGGTGLGLYLVKQRTEAMGGKVWAESAFGEGSTFYVSLPRLTSDEYEKRMIAVRNRAMQEQIKNETNGGAPVTNPFVPQPGGSPVSPVPPIPEKPAAPAPAPEAQPVPTPVPVPEAQSTPTSETQPAPTPEAQPTLAPQPAPAPVTAPQATSENQVAPTNQPAVPPQPQPDLNTPSTPTNPTSPTPESANPSTAPPGAPPVQPPAVPPAPNLTPVQNQINNNVNGENK